MTREEAKSCIGTIEMLQRLAYNIHGVMDVIDADNCKKIIKALEQEPTTKNDCAEQNGCITCSLDDGDDCCRKLYEESMQEPTTKNDLGVDCISRDEVCRYVAEFVNHEFSTREEEELIDNIITGIEQMPSVTPQEPQTFKWCTDCKEYDQEKHCCHRWSKVIRDTVEEMKQEQEPFKPMVEIDLYSVIKQKYIEREVLDKIREQMKDYLRGVEITLEVLVKNDPLRPKMEGAKDTLEECLNLIDKAEAEADNG